MREQPDLKDFGRFIDAALAIALVLAFVGLITAMLALSGCSTNIHDENIQKAFFATQTEVSRASAAAQIKPTETLTIECQPTCTFKKISYNSPLIKQGVAQTIISRPPTTGETGVKLAEQWADPVQNVLMLFGGLWGVNELVDTVADSAGNHIEGQNNAIISSTETGRQLSNTTGDANVSRSVTENNSVNNSNNPVRTDTVTRTTDIDRTNTNTNTNTTTDTRTTNPAPAIP